MEQENRRQWERFLHPAELQLTAGSHVLPVRLIDVSRQGMQVVAPVLLHVGDEIGASLPATLPTATAMPGAAGAVRGRVCWTAPARADGSPQTRAGILFEAPLAEAEPLPAVVAEQQAGSNVIVEFSGAMPQVMARALQSDGGLRLRFALPSLREGSVITLHSQDDVAKEMRIVGARLDDGGALVELLVEPYAESRRRRFLQYDEALPEPGPSNTEGLQLPAAATEATGSQELGLANVPKRRALAGAGVAASLMAAIWVAARASQPESEAEAEGEPEVARQAITRAAPEASRAPELVTAPDTRAAPARHTSAAAVSGTRSQALAAPAGKAEPAPAEPTAPPEPEPTVAPKPSATAARAEPSAKPTASPHKLSVAASKDTTEIFVPVTGSLAGLATKIWTDPSAVVVEIPRGQFVPVKKHYDIQKDGVVGISIGRPGGVTQIRVYVNSILSQYTATAVPGGVNILIKRDLQSLP